MGKPRIIKNSHNVGFYRLDSYEAKTIENTIAVMMENKEQIKAESPMIYTEKKDGVLPQYNIRTDKWDIAQKVMDRVNREKIAKGIAMENPNETEKNKKETAKGGESKDSGQPT